MYLSYSILNLTYFPRGNYMDCQLQKLDKFINIEGLYTFFYFEHDTNYFFPGEQHNFWEMVYVDRGEISAVEENTGYLVQQGELIFHKPNAFHTLASSPKEPHNILVVTFATQSPAMDFFKNKVFTLNHKQKKILSLILEEMRNALTSGTLDNKKGYNGQICDIASYQLGIAHLEHLLIELLRDNSVIERNENERKIARKNIENALVDSIKNHLQENIYNNIQLQEICSHYNLSKSYICEAFHKETGRSVIDYYIDLKIKEAKYLIRKGSLNFTQISEKLGYASIHHFSRSFKTKTGMSPSTYEKSIR